MTQKMQKLYEILSSDQELQAELTEEIKDIRDKSECNQKVIAFAKKQGIELTDDDFAISGTSQLSDDELTAVAGGGSCGCFISGGGDGDTLACRCILGGAGWLSGSHRCTGNGNGACACPVAGVGATDGTEKA